MNPTDHYPWVLREEARQEILDVWGNVLPVSLISLGFLLGEVDWRFRSMNMKENYTASDLDTEAALEVVEAYLF